MSQYVLQKLREAHEEVREQKESAVACGNWKMAEEYRTLGMLITIAEHKAARMMREALPEEAHS